MSHPSAQRLGPCKRGSGRVGEGWGSEKIVRAALVAADGRSATPPFDLPLDGRISTSPEGSPDPRAEPRSRSCGAQYSSDRSPVVDTKTRQGGTTRSPDIWPRSAPAKGSRSARTPPPRPRRTRATARSRSSPRDRRGTSSNMPAAPSRGPSPRAGAVRSRPPIPCSRRSRVRIARAPWLIGCRSAKVSAGHRPSGTRPRPRDAISPTRDRPSTLRRCSRRRSRWWASRDAGKLKANSTARRA
jgi:hypothetical protein